MAERRDSRTAEDRLTTWLRRHGGASTRRLGDDAAWLPPVPASAWSTDQQVAGVHVPADLDPAVVARRLCAVAVSDLAAAGARPWVALSTLAAPPDFDRRRFLRALVGACRRYGLELVGGDLARSPMLHASLTVAGLFDQRRRPLRRDAARPGDRLWLRGWPGLSALGCALLARGARPDGRSLRLPADLPSALHRLARHCLRLHLLPPDELTWSGWLARQPRAAAIDLSDGLALDLHRMLRASGVGAVLEHGSLLPPPPAAALAAWLDLDLDTCVLGGGEDYRVLAALPAATEPPADLAARPVGRVERRRGLSWRRGPRRQPLPPLGWDHLRAERPLSDLRS